MFYVGFISAIIGMLSVTYKTFKNKNILSPQMIMFAGILLFIYLPAYVYKYDGLYDSRFNFILFLGVLGTIIASHSWPYNILDVDKEEMIEPKYRLFGFFSVIYILFLCYEILQAIRASGSISALFASDRVSSYLGEGLVGGSAVRLLLIEGFKIFFYFYVAFLYENGKKIKAIMLSIVPLLHHLFTAVTRFDFVAMACAFIIYVVDNKMYENLGSEFNKSKLQSKKGIRVLRLIFIGVFAIYFALLFMTVANYIRHGITNISSIDFSLRGLFSNILSNDSKYYEYFYKEFIGIQNGLMKYEYGLTWWLYVIVNFIPRSIWHSKPYTSFSVRATEAFYWSYTSGNPVVTFTIFGEGYGQFGGIGCFLVPFLFLGSRWINFKAAKRLKYNRLYILIVMFSMLTFMRAEVPVFYAVVDGLWLWLISSYCEYGKIVVRIGRK